MDIGRVLARAGVAGLAAAGLVVGRARVAHTPSLRRRDAGGSRPPEKTPPAGDEDGEGDGSHV